LIQANSGAGKSYAVRKVAERTHGKIQQIIIDLEGEFSSLREKFDYILVGKDGDIPINIRASELLAKRLLELNTSVIIDLYELKHHERKHFVKLFFDAVINAPKELWHPCFVILDEAHIFAPEKGMGESEALDSVKDLATRGRKRGFALIAATQRISKLHKDVVAELNTKLIGRSSLDTDMKRAAFELGFTSKEDILSLRKLPKGVFYGFGPGLSSEIIKLKIDEVETTHAEAGKSYKMPQVVAPDKIKKILGKLADLPQAAEAEIKTRDDMIRKITELKRENAVLKREQPKPGIDKKQVETISAHAYKQGYEKCKTEHFIPFLQQTEFLKKTEKALKEIQQIAGKLNIEMPRKIEWPKYEKIKGPIKLDIPVATVKVNKPISAGQPITNSDIEKPEELRIGAMKMLKVVASFHPDSCSKLQLATMVGFSMKGGTFGTYLSELRRAGWIRINDGHISITDDGLANAGDVQPIPTDHDALLNMWCSKFREGAAKMLREICRVHPSYITREELGENTNFITTGGTFGTYLSELRRNGLITMDGQGVRASEALFP